MGNMTDGRHEDENTPANLSAFLFSGSEQAERLIAPLWLFFLRV
jgi:hypothetical protein